MSALAPTQFRPPSAPRPPQRRPAPALRTSQDFLASMPAEASTGARRRKSRSPGGQPSSAIAQAAARADAAQARMKVDPPQDPNSRRKRYVVPSVGTSATLRAALAVPADEMADRGRRPNKIKPKTQSRMLAENVERMSQVPLKREGSRSRDPHQLAKKHASTEMGVLDATTAGTQSQAVVQPDNNGMHAEFSRLKKEMEVLKKQLHDQRKTIKKQTKTIEDLRAEVTAYSKTVKEKDLSLQKYKIKSKKADDIMSTIENNLQCQICLDLLTRPYSLSPCGHVLCLTCLQEWFRKAPAAADEMYDDEGTECLIYRRKTCPCCRATVVTRPAPVFVVKSIVTAFGKAKASLSMNAVSASSAAASPNASTSPPTRTSPPLGSDPWAGIFPPISEDDYGHNEDSADDGADDDTDGREYDDWAINVFSYGTDSDEDTYAGNYVPPLWEPPTAELDFEELALEDVSEEEIALLRRGATLPMLRTYQMAYSHDVGMTLLVDEYCIYLGWNIQLSADDEGGEEFVEWLLVDMDQRPARWELSGNADGSWDARRLVPEDEVEEYDTTDTELYIDHDIDGL